MFFSPSAINFMTLMRGSTPRLGNTLDMVNADVSALSVQTDTAVSLEAWGVGHLGP